MPHVLRWTASAACGLLALATPPATVSADPLAADQPRASDARPATRPSVLPDESRFDSTSFARLDPAGRLAFVRRALAWRDEELANFDYEVAEAIRVIDVRTGTEVRQWSRGPYRIKRLGDRFLFSGMDRFGGPEEPRRRFAARWDGHVYRGIEATTAVTARGDLQPTEHGGITLVAFNHLLGFRVGGVERFGAAGVREVPVTFPEWIDAFGHDQRSVTADVEPGPDGKPTVVVRGVSGFVTHTFWLDPSRDYLPVRYKRWYQVANNPGRGEEQWVADARRIDGLWVPTATSEAPPVPGDAMKRQERTYTVSRFTRNTVAATDLLVPFPPGTEVLDTASMVSYVVGAGGTVTPRAMGDAAMGLARTATPAELEAALALNPLADDVTPGRRPASRPTMSPGGR